MKKILGIAACALLGASLFVSCGSTAKVDSPAQAVEPSGPKGPLNTSTKTGMDAIPAEALEQAAGFNNAEDIAGTSFAKSTLGPWKLNNNKSYVIDDETSMYINVQYEGEKWDKDITKDKAALIDVGKGDKALALNLGLNKSNDKYGVLFNISKQGAAPMDISNYVFTIRMYIPEELTLPNKEEFYPSIKLAIRDTNWTQYFLSGEGIKEFSFYDLGSGWQTLQLDFSKLTYRLGSKTGVFKASSATMKRCNMIDMYIQGKSIASNLDVPIIIDYVSLTPAPEK